MPLAITSGLLIGSDTHSIGIAHIDAQDRSHANRFSEATLGISALVPFSMYLYGGRDGESRAHETGLLSAEAVSDSLLIDLAAKGILRRSPPLSASHPGDFFTSNLQSSSMPSGYATAAWSIAAVVSEEHKGWLASTLMYTLAASTSVGRGVAEKNSPGDIFVGSALGWLVGYYTYRAHHHEDLTSARVTTGSPNIFTAPLVTTPPTPNTAASTASSTPTSSSAFATPPAPATTIGSTSQPLFQLQSAGPLSLPTAQPSLFSTGSPKAAAARQPWVFDPDKTGSPNVPMDSWVYPALERLSSMGFIPTQSMAIRPWTRVECYRQIHQAMEIYESTDPEDPQFTPGERREAARLLNDLQQEFDRSVPRETSEVFESAYVRGGVIAGPAINDSYHIGQTWWNDFGRPQGRGTNAIAGFSAYTTAGRTFLYVREEMQHGPGTQAYSLSLDQVIANQDDNPVIPTFATPAYQRYRPLEMYTGIAFDGNVLSFGKQEIYWGPTTMGGLSFSSNAEPTYNLRFVSGRPHPLPFFPNLGTYRFDLVFGKLSGHHWPNRPYYNGQKANFNFGPNFEVSFTRWSILWGVGHPMNLHTLIRNLVSVSSTDVCAYGVDCDAGARNSEFDFRYHLPWLRHLVTLYSDSYVHDSVNPIDDPRKSVWGPGIYFARLPWLPHMDLRVEAASSNRLTQEQPLGPQEYFYDNQYHDVDTNKGFLLGNAVGRDGRAEEGRLGWWQSSRTRFELGYRQNKVGHLMLPQGGTMSDGFANASMKLSPHWDAKLFLQYERFLLPAYIPGAQHNTSGWFELIWHPMIP